MYTIGELVKLDEHITEQSVVQIDFYTERERNLTLLRNFVFARSAPAGMVSNLDVLDRLREASLTDAKENIFCIIANYGQGKSHLGLVLANYFGREVSSEEFRVVMDKIAHAEGDEVRVRNLREFREQRQPYLVIRLRGDVPLPLDQQFLQAVQRALHEAGVEGKLPLWYEKAAEWLQSLPARGMEAQANEFLKQHEMDVPALIDSVKRFDGETYDIVNQMFRHLIGTYPHFEGGLQPKEILRWLVEHYCDGERRFGGVLVLFDEFSQFVERYYSQRQYAGSLQSLLETVDSLRRTVLFVAFAQHDPSNMVRHIVANATALQQEEALRELQRLPENNKLLLHTRMERVIDGYLRHEGSPFSHLLQQREQLDNQIWDASMLAMKVFAPRYDEQQGWTSEQFYEIVGKGCFPLHPLTTAILGHGMPTTTAHLDAPRTVLGFVLDRVRAKLAEPAVVADGKPNWIYPIELVDYFYRMIPEQQLLQYRTAQQRIDGTPTPSQMAVLKAILLIALVDPTIRGSDFSEVVSHLSGLNTNDVEHTLQQLADSLALYREPSGKYRFYSLGGDPNRLQQLKQEMWSQPPSEADMKLLNERFQVSPEVSISWGHRDDWQARQVIWRVSDFTEQNLQREAPLFRVDRNGLNIDAKRGLVIRLLALSEEEMTDLRERVCEILDRAFPDENAPAVLVVLPPRPMPDLLRWVRWDNYVWLGMSPADRQQIGEELIQTERRLAQSHIEQDKSSLLRDRVSEGSLSEPWLIVPKAYRAAFERQDPHTVGDALRYLYAKAYRFAPPFFTQYHHGSIHLRSDVRKICLKLAEDRVGDIVNTFGNMPGTDCVHRYLQQEWHILRSDYRVQPPPDGSKVKSSWELLDQTLLTKETATPVRDVLLRLMNPPHGYHFHQLALLFSAWYGYYRKQIELSIDGRLDHLQSIWAMNGVDRSERFLTQMVYVHQVTIKRRNIDEELERVQGLVKKILSRTEYLSMEEAEAALSVLKSALEQQETDDRLREDAQRCIQALNEDIQTAKQYSERAAHLLKMAESETQLRPLAEAYAKPNLPSLGIVHPGAASPQEIQARLMDRISQRVEAVCREAEGFDRIEDVSKYQERLRAIIPYVRLTGNQDLEARVKKALSIVEQRAKELRQRAAEAGLIGEIRAMSSTAPLLKLREYQERLQQVTLQSEEGRELHRQKQEEISQAIERSVHRLQQWCEAFAKAEDRNVLEQLQKELNRYWTHYENTPEAQQLKELESECAEVLRLLEHVSQIAASRPAGPEGVYQALQRLKEVRSQNTHPAVQRTVQREERQLEEYAQGEVERALRWLGQKEQDALRKHGDDLLALKQELLQPPAFLPASERERLQRLERQVQERLDADAEQSIRVRLRQIRDPQKLLQLREEIDRLIAEMQVAVGSQ